MRVHRSPWFLVAVCCLLVASGSVPVAGQPATGPSGMTTDAGTTQASDGLDRRYVLALAPDYDGAVRVRLRYRIPDRVTSLTASLPANTTVESARGFRRADERTYEWTRTESEPQITYRLPVNETVPRGIEGERSGGYLFVATDSWAILRAPQTGLTISGTGERPAVDTTYGFDGQGATTGGVAYLGPHRTVTREAGGQRLRLVVPAAADMRESPGTVLDSLAGAAGTLEIGPRDEEVVGIAAPTTVEWGAAGLQRGDADFWVLADRRVDTPANVWLHEYVHTRQAYRPDATTTWTLEGMADYYAALLTYRQGRIDYEQFHRHLERGRASRYADVSLATPDTWRGTLGAYDKGALVFGALDRRIRLATDRSATLQAVVRRFNEADRTVDRSAFLAAVREVGGAEVHEFARRYAETTAAPDTWSREEHLRAFDGVSFAYEFAPEYERTGPYRNDTAGAAPSVVTGETLAFGIAVENTGESTGEYRVTVRANGEPMANQSATLAAGARETLTVRRTFTEPGEVTVTAGGAAERVTVRRPAELRVRSLSAPQRAVVGRPVDVAATVESRATRPAEGTVALRSGDRIVAERLVRLDAGETATLAGTVTFDEPGEFVVAAGDRSRTIRVVAGTPSATTAPGATTRDGGQSPATAPPSGSGPGFGVLAALVALAALAVGARRE